MFFKRKTKFWAKVYRLSGAGKSLVRCPTFICFTERLTEKCVMEKTISPIHKAASSKMADFAVQGFPFKLNNRENGLALEI